VSSRFLITTLSRRQPFIHGPFQLPIKQVPTTTSYPSLPSSCAPSISALDLPRAIPLNPLAVKFMHQAQPVGTTRNHQTVRQKVNVWTLPPNCLPALSVRAATKYSPLPAAHLRSRPAPSGWPPRRMNLGRLKENTNLFLSAHTPL
jgi:hypothetical protein